MARIIVNGSKVQIATGYDTAFAITDISNASTAVATVGTGHGVVGDDFLELTDSVWPSLAGRVFRVAATSATSITLEGLDTSSTAIYPTWSGTGTGKGVTGWADVAQVNSLDVTGGEQQYAEGQYLDVPLTFRFPTVKSALNISVNVDDDQTASFWTHVNASEAALSNRAMRVLDVNSIPRIVLTGIWSKSSAPAVAVNNVLKRTIGVAAAAGVTEYTSA
jgi:hypothetical protein